ncbi:MAG: decaprenyl-phosphate phosphoribosyltransferase [archaeon]
MKYLNLLRPQQWYKNLVIFTALFFSGNLLVPGYILPTIVGFISLCLVSSANYIINDLVDAGKDRRHPEKAGRPIASGHISSWSAVFIAIMLAVGGLLAALSLDAAFSVAVVLIFALTSVYSFWAKNEPILDIILVALNFVVRTVSGAFIIKVWISPWLILCPFFLSMFLTVGKRRAELRFLGKASIEHRKVLGSYSMELLDSMMIIVTTVLIISYSLYSFLSVHALLLTLPIVIYAVFRYIWLVQADSVIARHPEKALADWRIILALLAWLVSAYLVIYAFF